MAEERLEIVIAARDLASGVLKGVAGLSRMRSGASRSSAKGLATASTQMAGSTVTGFGRMKASAAGYRAELGLGSIAIAGFAGAAILGMKNVIDAAMKEEQVQARLNAAIHSTGHAINSAKLEELARDLARITPFAKSDTEGIMALQVQMGLSEDQVLKLTPPSRI